MSNLRNRLEILWRALIDKDVLLLSLPNGLKAGENKTYIITVTNNKDFDALAESLMVLLGQKIKNS